MYQTPVVSEYGMEVCADEMANISLRSADAKPCVNNSFDGFLGTISTLAAYFYVVAAGAFAVVVWAAAAYATYVTFMFPSKMAR